MKNAMKLSCCAGVLPVNEAREHAGLDLFASELASLGNGRNNSEETRFAIWMELESMLLQPCNKPAPVWEHGHWIVRAM